MDETTGTEPRDRRRGDRRSGDRRSAWGRGAGWTGIGRPAAYGAGAVIILILLVRLVTGGDEPTNAAMISAAADAADTEAGTAPAALPATAPAREAFSVAEYEALLAEGDAAVGEIVRTELFCGPLTQVSIREDVAMHQTIRDMADAEGRVVAADCRWSRESLSSDVLLVVPPDFATDFANAPTVEISFVTRRRVRGDIEWLGRSPELALRNAGILRRILP